MGYALGQALLWTGIGFVIMITALAIFLKPIVFLIGQGKRYVSKAKKEAIQSYQQGLEEKEEEYHGLF